MTDALKQETLRERFRRLQWEGRYEEAEEIELEVFRQSWEEGSVGAFSARSSFFYSWAGNVLKSGGRLACLRELPTRLWRFYRLMKYAQVASKNMLHNARGFRHRLTADELDVRSSIYLRLWNMYGRLSPDFKCEVFRCVDAALAKQDVKPHTLALLHITRGKVQGGYRSSEGRQDFEEAERLVPAIRESGELEQLARVYRHLANYYKKADVYGKELEYAWLARKTAAEARATDQLIKMGTHF